jgi:diketogulonate reductase-like aldo/keto reductase
MSDRREFLRGVGAAALTAVTPQLSLAGQRRLATRRIPGTDERLAVVGLGQSRAFREGDAETSKQLLSTFFDYGGGYVDCRGDSRFHVASVSKSLGGNESVFLGSYFSGEDVANSESSAQRLRAIRNSDSLDLMHGVPENGVPNWDVFRGWKDAGLTRHIGLARHNASYYDAMMKVMATGTMDFVQVNLSPLETEAEDRILPMAMDKGIAVTINRPFINGGYFSIVRGRQLPGWAIDFDCTSWAQFSIKYVLSHPAVVCVLTETANPDHLRDNLGGGVGRLPDAATRKKMRELIQSFA